MDMNNILIRKAKECDLPRISKLAEELIQSVDNREGIAQEVMLSNCHELLENPYCYILLAEINDKVVGFISFTTRKTILHSGLSGLIDELIVSQNNRGKGIGKKLISAAVEKCKHLGCCEVEVSTEFANTKARGFYKTCGFTERGIHFEKELS